MKRPFRQPRLECSFLRLASGGEPVRDWLKSLSPEARKEIGSDIQIVQWRWPIGAPIVASLGEGLWEVRSTHGGIQYRVLFCVVDRRIVLLHGFVKKRRKAPRADLDLARRRQRDVEDAK